MERQPWIIGLGGGVHGYVAGEMITDDPMVRRWLDGVAETVEDPISIVLGVAMAALGWWFARGRGRWVARTRA